MKSHRQLFSFMLEMIIVIFFFALSSTVCVSLIVNSKRKVDEGKQIQASLLEATNMINIMQSEKDKEIEELFEVQKEDGIYKYHDLTIQIDEQQIKKGKIIINDDITIDFVIGGKDGQ